MVLQLAEILENVLRQQNLMLTAIGFAPIYGESLRRVYAIALFQLPPKHIS
jgi:hypothetical protein